MKTENVVPLTVKGVFLTLHTRPGDETTPLTGTNDWTLIEMVFDSGTDDTIQINCVLGFKGLVRGTVWFDDIRLKFISCSDSEANCGYRCREDSGSDIEIYLRTVY